MHSTGMFMRSTRMLMRLVACAVMGAFGPTHALSAAIAAAEELPVSRRLPEVDASPAAAAADPVGMGLEGVDGLLIVDAEVAPTSGHCLTWSCCPPGADPAGAGYPTVAVNGFFHADAIFFAQDAANVAVVGDAQDVADFRRARLSAKGNVAENVSYFVEYDFAFPGRPSFMDVYVEVADLSRFGHVRIGQFRAPCGMDVMTSVKELTFLERALPSAFAPFRQIGIELYDTALDERATWSVAGYRFPTNVFGNASGDSGYGCATRETLLLYEGQCNRTIHLGGGFTYNQPSGNSAILRSTPEVGFTQLDFNSTVFPVPFFVDTGTLEAENFQVMNVELAGSRGPWLGQSEFYFATIDQLNGTQARFHGAYAQVSYVLTGEHREYIKKQGVYGRFTPHANYGKCGIGGWELAGRYSYLDHNAAALAPVGAPVGFIPGGKLQDITLGLNWRLNRYTEFQFNYIHAFLDRPAGNNSDADILAARAQVEF